MKLNSETHVLIYDLMECYATTSKDRVKQSLLSAVHTVLQNVFDSDEVYTRSTLDERRGELIYTQIVSSDEHDETDYDEPDVEYRINIKTGRYTREEQ